MDRKQHSRAERLLLEAARSFNSTLDYEELIGIVLRLVIKSVEADAALIFRIDHQRTDMRVRHLRRGDEQFQVFRRELGEGVVDWVAQYREPAIVNASETDDRIDHEIEQHIGVQINSLISVPLIGRGQMIGVIEAFNAKNGGFDKEDLDLLLGLSNQIAVAIDNANLYRTMKREALEKQTLYEIGIKLSGKLVLKELTAEIMDSLKKVVAYDAGGLFLVDPDDLSIGPEYIVGYDGVSAPDLHLKIGQGLIGYVAKTGEPVIVPDVRKDERYINAREESQSEIALPIKIQDRLVGVFALESDHLNAYGEADLRLMTAFAAQAAISIERARLYEGTLRGQKLQEQVNVAREIQRSFLPPANPNIENYDIAGRNISSGEVGGDYYDFIRIVDSQNGIALADCSGKGVPAALLMASFRASLIAEIRNNYSIRTILHKVNNLMCESIKPGNFVTAVYGVLDTRNHTFTYANAGHLKPILIRANGSIEYLGAGGQIMGVTANTNYDEQPIFLSPGDLIFFYTDGVTEVFDRNGEQFDEEGLERVLRKCHAESAARIEDMVYSELKKFAARDHVFDDLTMIVVKRSN